MRLQVKGKNVEVTPSIREYAERKLAKLGKQLAEQTQVEVELSEQKNPSIAASAVAEGTIFTKGPTLRAKESSPDMKASIDQLVDKLERQVKRYRERRDRAVRLVLVDDDRAVRERHEVHRVAPQAGRLRRRDGVPFPRPRHPVDARFATPLAVPAGRLRDRRGRHAHDGDPCGLRELLVQRLSPAEQLHYAASPLCSACRRGSTVRRSR